MFLLERKGYEMKKVTSYEIAKEANVSVMTVTRAFKKNSVIKPETRERILSIAEKYGYQPNSLAARLAQDRLLISVIVENTFLRLTEELTSGMELAENMLKDQKVDLDLHVISYQNNSSQTIIGEIDTAVDSGAKGLILVMGHYTQDIIDRLNDIIASGIPVVTLINNPQTINRLCNIQVNEYMIGHMAAELLSGSIREGEVVVLLGDEEADVHKEMLKGFTAALEDSEVRLYNAYDIKENLEFSRQIIRQIIAQKPDIKGIFISTALSVAVLEELNSMNLSGKIKVITSDLFPELIDYINNGTVQATIFKDPSKQMVDAISKLYINISGISDDTTDIRVVPQIIIKSNLSAFLEEK